MRARLILAALATACVAGVAGPAAAGGWDDSRCCGGTVYVHHHYYAPVRYRHVYHLHRPGPLHVNVVHYGGFERPYGCCGPRYTYNRSYAGYMAAPRFYQYRWRWNR